MADRADWEAATQPNATWPSPRRRTPPPRPSEPFPPLRWAEPEPADETQRTELSLTPGEPPDKMGQWIKDLAAAYHTFAERLANLQSLTISSQGGRSRRPRPGLPALAPAGRDAILQPPKPQIRPSPYVLERAADRDADWEAAD